MKLFAASTCIINHLSPLGLHSWRSLGDVIASLFALGYHENIQSKSSVPRFLIELRRTAFAQVYSADKNVAIFLGRPPRMSKRFSHFQIPSSRANLETHLAPENRQGVEDWEGNKMISYRAEARWTAICAFSKDEILELLYSEDRGNHAQRARSVFIHPQILFIGTDKVQSEITSRAEAQWQALPDHFRLRGSLKQCPQSPFERDFLVSTRLNHLHLLFLLRLVLLNRLAEPDSSIVEIAQQMLALVVEAILFRDHLANSGTGLIWKVCQAS